MFDSLKKADLGSVSPSMAGRFYQRHLPQSQVPFASDEGRRLFREALAAGHMENYFFLAEQFRTQDGPTLCGLATLAMVLNSLRIDPMRTWQGAWRWFNEQNLGCCASERKVRQEGLTYDMFGCLAGCNGARVSSHRAPVHAEGEESFESFLQLLRATVRATSSSQERECLVFCYSRKALGQSGAGHFSPIGGYHEDTDSVLIMDVARFKYPPHWASLRDVAEGMRSVDEDTGRPRGYLHLRAHPPADDGRAQLKPLHIPFVPPAAGRRLSRALAGALGAPTPSNGAWAEAALHRWIQAASVVEPQVLGKLLQVGDTTAFIEVLRGLRSFPAFQDLCHAYASLAAKGWCGDLCLAANFPPLLLHGTSDENMLQEKELNLATCGELWVLLLLLLPEHLRGRAAPELRGSWIANGIKKSLRGPWALPLEALRDVLGQLLQEAAPDHCANQRHHL